MAMDQAATDPTAAPAETSNDYEICISVTGGKISVGVESAAAEAAEGGNEEGGEAGEGDKPVGSIREAVALAMEIYQNDGAMPDGSDDAEFNGGFGKQAAAPKDKMFNEE
jgi:hypothetical protein